MKPVRKVATKKFDECNACGKRLRSDWYMWIDLFIEVGNVISDKVCKKCTINWVGRKNKNLNKIIK